MMWAQGSSGMIFLKFNQRIFLLGGGGGLNVLLLVNCSGSVLHNATILQM